jgi:hypothetical protein
MENKPNQKKDPLVLNIIVGIVVLIGSSFAAFLTIGMTHNQGQGDFWLDLKMLVLPVLSLAMIIGSARAISKKGE